MSKRSTFLMLALLFVAACRDDSGVAQSKPTPSSRGFWLAVFERGLAQQSYCDPERERIAKLVSALRTQDSVGPQITRAELKMLSNGGGALTVYFYDEARAVRGFRLVEKARSGEVVSEDYVLYPTGRDGASLFDSIAVRVTLRAGRRQDTRAWNEYIRLGIAAPKRLPEVYVSEPGVDCLVTVSLLTGDGKTSLPAELTLSQHVPQSSPQ